MEQIEKLK
jgi:hypothetical protein